jgi:hypothetical protein
MDFIGSAPDGFIGSAPACRTMESFSFDSLVPTPLEAWTAEPLPAVHDERHSVRYPVILLGLLLSACSTVDAPAPVYVAPSPPSLLALREGIKKASSEEKLSGPIELSALRKADRGFGQYFVCMREANSSSDRHAAYSVFFDNDDYKGVRQSVIIEACETQVFNPPN